MRESKWTYDICKNEANKYVRKCDFKKLSGACYNACRKNGWLNELTTHMSSKCKPNNFWTYEKCKEEALKYNSRGEFAKSPGCAYDTSRTNDWLDEICSHMIIVGNHKNRCIYAYEFDDNHVYIGLTYNLENRVKRRMSDDRDIVNYYIKNKNANFNIIQLSDYVDFKEAVHLEKIWLNNYIKTEWIILNRAKTGSLGGNVIIWSYEYCQSVVSNYSSINDFRNNEINCYSAILKNNWGDKLFKSLKYTKLPNNYWTYDKCLEVALLCSSRTEMARKYSSAYNSSKSNGWNAEIFELANLNIKPSLLYYEITDEEFEIINNDRNHSNLSYEKLAKKYKVGLDKLSKKFKEHKITNNDKL